MARVNNQSLREEFDTLKARFERLSADDTMAAESRALCQAMLMLFEVLMAVFMEKRTVKDNKNSSLPSSQTAPGDDTATRPGSNPKGKAQNNACAGNTRTLETVQIAPVSVCERCGEDLSETPCHTDTKDAPRSTSSSRRSSATWTPRSSNAPIARRGPRDLSRRTCTGRCNMGPASRPMP